MPAFRDGAYPMFTLKAHAHALSAEGETDPLIASIADKIVVGDGILEFLAWRG